MAFSAGVSTRNSAALKAFYIHVCLLSKIKIKWCILGGGCRICCGSVLLLTLSKVLGETLQAPWVQAGHKWLCLLHVRQVLIPALNELANGRPLPLTRFPHTFTHQALLAWPLGRQSGGNVGLAFNLRALASTLVHCITDVFNHDAVELSTIFVTEWKYSSSSSTYGFSLFQGSPHKILASNMLKVGGGGGLICLYSFLNCGPVLLPLLKMAVVLWNYILFLTCFEWTPITWTSRCGVKAVDIDSQTPCVIHYLWLKEHITAVTGASSVSI